MPEMMTREKQKERFEAAVRRAEAVEDLESVQNLVIEASFAWERLMEAKTMNEQATAVTVMNNLMSDLATWMPGWNSDTGRIEGYDE